MNAYATLIGPAPAAMVPPSLFARRGGSARRVAAAAPRVPSSGDDDARGVPPLFYADDRPSLPAAAHRERSAPGVVALLQEAPDHAARQALMKEQLRAIGFEWMGYGSAEDNLGRLRPLSFLTSYANENWTRRYFSQRHYRADTRPYDAPVSGLPLVWDLESIEQSHSRQPMRDEAEASGVAQRQRMLRADLQACGIRSGIFFRLATPGLMNEYTLISLLSAKPGRRWIADGVVGRALMLGLSLHEHVSRHVQKTPALDQGEVLQAKAPTSPMSATQQSILEALLRGLGDKEIAYTLGLSSHAVDYHMRQLRRRFGVRNRVQLVSAAADWQP